MGISGVNGAGRVSPLIADPKATPATTPPLSPREAGLVELDETTQQPLPPRFPWLSRLTAQLEPVARQQSPFTAAPMLGDNIDHAV